MSFVNAILLPGSSLATAKYVPCALATVPGSQVVGDAEVTDGVGIALDSKSKDIVGQKLNAVAVDQHGDGNCVAPSAETALNGTYEPLARPLFIYTRESFLKERPEILGFVNFYLENVQTLVPQAGYIQLPEAVLQAQYTKLEGFLP